MQKTKGMKKGLRASPLKEKKKLQAAKGLLEPLANKYSDFFNEVVREVHLASDEHLGELLRASLLMTQFNCWFATYEAAQALIGNVRSEIRRRAELKGPKAPKTPRGAK